MTVQMLIAACVFVAAYAFAMRGLIRFIGSATGWLND